MELTQWSVAQWLAPTGYTSVSEPVETIVDDRAILDSQRPA
jgi:hypothetical protein